MTLPELAIKRPVFIACVAILIVIMGFMAYRSLGVDLFPDVSFPVVSVTTNYKGAAPEEIEAQISKPMEEQFSTIQGVKQINSTNEEGYSVVVIQFTLETDSKEAEQRVRDRLSLVRPLLPKDIEEPVIQRLDPSDQPIMTLGLKSDLTSPQAYDLADQVIKPHLAQLSGVGVVDIFGASKREIRVELDRNKLNAYRLSASGVADNIGLNGLNVPVGKFETAGNNVLFRSVGQYDDLDRLRHTVVNFVGSDVPITVDKIGRVVDTVEDAQNYSSFKGVPGLFLRIHKQTKSNTVAVAEEIKADLDSLNAVLKTHPGNASLSVIQDDSWGIRLNLDDVQQTIFLGIILTVLVVLLFLGSFRSTLITITALPTSLLGAFIIMNWMGFTLNFMTILALSLAVGLLIDDAIVVRENIWRHMEEGEEPKKAAEHGTMEVALAVVATTGVILAVFMPIAFLKGTVGQFFKQFGMTVCFAMVISLFEALTMGPMLSAYWAGQRGKPSDKLAFFRWFDNFQTWLEKAYEKVIGWCLRFPAEKVIQDARTNGFNFFRVIFRWVYLAFNNDRLIAEVQFEQKNGYSFAPFFYSLLEFILLVLAALHSPIESSINRLLGKSLFYEWEPFLLLAGLFGYLFKKNLGKKESWLEYFFDFNGWMFLFCLGLSFADVSPLLKGVDPVYLLVTIGLASIQWVIYYFHIRYFLFAHQLYDHRWWILQSAFVIFVVSLGMGKYIPFTFVPNGDNPEFQVALKGPPNMALDTTRDWTSKVSAIVRSHPEIDVTAETVGDTQGNENVSNIYIRLIDYRKRKKTADELKVEIRKELEPYRELLQPQIGDRDALGNQAPFNLDIVGPDYKVLQPIVDRLMAKIKNIPGLEDVETNYDGGKAEFQAVLDPAKCRQLGVLGIQAGDELRTQIEGTVPAKFRENGLDYDIRVRMQDDQRNLQKDFNNVYVPNTNNRMVRLSDIAAAVTTEGPSKINRLDRQRYIEITGQLGKGGALGNIINQANKILAAENLPPGITGKIVGQGKDLQDLSISMLVAMALAVLFTYMILASLYDSPIIPGSIMISIPLAIVGAFAALLLMHQSLNIFTMISLIMLMGLVTKNAILLVDYVVRMENEGMSRDEAIRRAGVIRLRPILMTTMALIMGMMPVALALNEVAKFRQSMGVAVIGGLISSLILTLIVVPSVYGYFDDLRLWLRRLFGMDEDAEATAKVKSSSKLRPRKRA